MKKYVISIVFVFVNLSIHAQLYDINWLIGQGYTYVADMRMDSIQPYIHRDTTILAEYEILYNSSCISNENGNFTLFTNGRDIMNDSGNVIQGGSKIMDSMINEVVFYGLEMSQSSIILPKKNNQYYVVYMSQSDELSLLHIELPNRLYYAIVDMNANNGKGKVLQKKIPIITGDSIGDSRMTACRHANGRDWWLVCHGREYDNKIYISLVTPDTIYLHHEQFDIMPIYKELYADGQSCFSPDARHYIACTPVDGTGLYDFDRCIGEFSNTRVMNFIRDDSVFLYTPTSIGGCAFSANSKYFYMATTRMVAQFCLDSTDIMSSFRFVALYDSTYKNLAPFNSLMLAPNNKIYISNLFGTTNTYHTINNPDTIAAYVNYAKENVTMPRSARAVSLPNMPFYRLGPSPVYTLDAGNDTTVCDTMNISLGYTPIYNLPLTGILDTKMHIEWSASSPYIIFNDIHAPYPIATTSKKGNYQIYLSLHDTINTLTCTDRIDTMNVSFIHCDTISPSAFAIVTLWDRDEGLYTIKGLPANSTFEVFNTIGQLIYNNKNYNNNWNTNQVSNGIYIYRLSLQNGKVYKGKIFVY